MSASFLRKPWVWVLVGIAAVLIIFTLLPGGSNTVDATLTEFMEDARARRIENVEVDGRYLEYRIIGSELTLEARMEEGDTVRQLLEEAGLDADEFPPIKTKERSWWSRIPFLLIGFLPSILIFAILVALLRWIWSKVGTRTTGSDPVCGRHIRPKDAVASSTFQDVSYRFCSLDCKHQFDADPVRYLLQR